MIPFSSQRGAGQDLATHLQNAHDNEHIELAELRGAVAPDLHGAFAEWEVQAQALTRCRNYLYSLSVNPDPAQGPLTRDKYRDYIDRAEDRLGLVGQPRAIVFHIKPDRNGQPREHCHVVWSRINARQGRAVHMAFDHDKLMMVTREFARDHGLTLPDGYHRGGGRQKAGQLSLYEQHQQRTTGLSREERREQVTDAWRASDSPQAFVQALAAHGYILATGRGPSQDRSREAAWAESPPRRRRGGRPYVLVDLYGEMNALPKLIDDRTVRTKDIRAFLGSAFPPESLPSVEEAKKLVAAHRKALSAHRDNEQRAEAQAHLAKAQARRRQKVEEHDKALRRRRHHERIELARQHRTARDGHRAAYLAQVKTIRAARYANRPTGLAAFLGRITGMAAVRKAIYRYRDRQRYRAYVQARSGLRHQQDREQCDLQYRHEMQQHDRDRHSRALDHIDRRERQSLQQSLRADRRITARGGNSRMPPLRIAHEPESQATAPAAQKLLFRDWLTQSFEQALTRRHRPVDLEDAFTRAATPEEETGGKGTGSSEGPQPAAQPRSPERDHDKDQER